MDGSSATIFSPGAPSCPVTVTLFGSFQLVRQDQEAVNFRSNKARAAFAYLMLARSEPIARSILVDLLWHDYTPSAARANLRQVLTNVRDLLAPFDLLQGNYQTVQLLLDPASVWCDVLAFDELLAACQRHSHPSLVECPLCQSRLQQAVALYKGPFLDGFKEVDSPPFQAWRETQRSHYAARYVEIQAALRPVMTPRGNLPQPLTSLLGRTAELRDLATKVMHPVYRCLTLVGPGGIGKTRLALALGEQMRTSFADGVWFVALAGLDAPRSSDSERAYLVDRIATAICTTLRLSLQGATPPIQQLTAYLHDKTLLLILDNFEHLRAGVSLLVTLLQDAPYVRIVVTSRHRLTFQGQLVYLVAGLALPPETGDAALPIDRFIARYASVQLFVERATIALLPLAQDSTNLVAISALCRLVDGAPLGIELAVALLEIQTPSEILQAVRRHYTALQADWQDLPERQRSAQALLFTAWRLLNPVEAQLLARCSAFRGEFTLAAAQQIVDATPTSLEALVHKSLLYLTQRGHYGLHELVRQFAAEQLAQDTPMTTATRDRHAAYYLALVKRWQPAFVPPRLFIDTVQQASENVEAAWVWTLTRGDVTEALAALPGLGQFYQLTARFHAAVATFTNSIGHLRTVLGDAATPHAGVAVSTSHVRPLQQLLAQVGAQLGAIYNEGLLGDAPQLLTWAQATLDWGLYLDDPSLQVEGYYLLSYAAGMAGDYVRQQALLETALPLAQAHNLRVAVAHCFLGLGACANGRYEHSVAEEFCQKALTLARQSHELSLELRILNDLARNYRDAGDLGQAAHYIEEMLGLAHELGQNNSIAYGVAQLGLLYLLLGEFPTAQRYLEEAHERFLALGNQQLVAEVLIILGALFEQWGDGATAIRYCQQTLDLATPRNYYVAQRVAWTTLGNVYFAQGEWALAEEARLHAIRLAQAAGNTVDVVLEQASLAEILVAQQKLSEALNLVQGALAALASGEGGIRANTAVYFSCYTVLAANHDPRATDFLQQAWALVQTQAAKISDPKLRDAFLTKAPLHRTLATLIEAQT